MRRFAGIKIELLFNSIYKQFNIINMLKKIFKGSVALLERGRDQIYLSQPEIHHRDQSSWVQTHPDAAWWPGDAGPMRRDGAKVLVMMHPDRIQQNCSHHISGKTVS